ncbi:UDP-2,3-diacylglucosamine diphosphatase LpxI domain-containing protein [Pelagicoccus enzymogenes]|uniref:UDP-2,3-diacylglucosamine diphosphatase LpxI domain-containing protein n=1 Tax=Pelagicoccus enzymogenes TaxID=2773457 RepID=UPI0031BB5A19
MQILSGGFNFNTKRRCGFVCPSLHPDRSFDSSRDNGLVTYRFDVPVFGLRTLEIMAEHNIGTAVLKAGDVIMVEKVPSPATRSKILEVSVRNLSQKGSCTLRQWRIRFLVIG